MKVLLDGYWWLSGPPSGRMVLREIVKGWQQAFPSDDLTLLVPATQLDAARSGTPGLSFVGSRLRVHPLLNTLGMAVAARRHGPFDAVVTQNFAATAPNGGVFVHDVLFQSDPSWFTRTERAYLSLIPWLARRARVVYTSSETERRRISTHNRRLTNVVATGLGTPSALAEATATADDSLLPGQFLLTVGRLNVRKNLAATIEAALRSGRVSPAVPLVIVGARDGRTEALPRAVEDAINDGTVRFLGGVDDGRLRWLYQECRLMLFLSLDEGYGLPPIEALAAGAPVVASDRAVFREVLGDEVVYCDPTDVADISRTIERQLDKPWKRVRRTAPGNHDWADVARSIRSGLLPSTRKS